MKSVSSTVEGEAATSSFTPASKLTYVGQNKTPDNLKESQLNGDQSSKELQKPATVQLKPGLNKSGDNR